MKIKDIAIEEVRIPLVTPFKTALRTVDSVNDIVVKVISDEGETGFGEAPPTAVITGDTKGSVKAAVMDFIRPSIVGMDIDNLEGIMERLNACMVKNTSAKAAVDMAVYDLWAKYNGKPLYKLLGGYRNEIETDITISVNPIDEMVADSVKAVNQGFNILKVKVGKEGIKDVERVAAIRKAVGDSVRIRVDANQGWSMKEAVRIITMMEDAGLGIDLVEQPLPAADIAGMKYVTDRVYTPILADESVFSARDAVEIIKEHAADMINIKLMKTGGIYNALKLCSIAEVYGVECMVGCMLESKIAVSAASHLAAAKKIITMADLDGPSLCKIDIYEGGPTFDRNRIIMNEEPGIGIKGFVD